MPKEEKIEIDELDINKILPETVICSIIGRTIASLGSTMTGRERHNANLLYILLKAGRKYSEEIPTKAEIEDYKKQKKYSPTEAIKWFSSNYPKESEPLLKKLEEEYEKPETSLTYGLKKGKNFSDDEYIEIMEKILDIPKQDARILYHGVIRPHLEREKENEGLTKLLIKNP